MATRILISNGAQSSSCGFYIVKGLTKSLWKNSVSISNGGVNFFIVFFHFSIGKAAMNALHLANCAKTVLPALARSQQCLSRLSNCKWKMTIKNSWCSIVLNTFPASLIVFFLLVLHVCTHVLSMPMHVEGGGGMAALHRGWRNSVLWKVDSSAGYRPCSALEKSAINFHIWHRNWFPNCQLKKWRRSKTLKGSQSIVGGQNLLKISAPFRLTNIYKMWSLLAWSISLDFTF